MTTDQKAKAVFNAMENNPVVCHDKRWFWKEDPIRKDEEAKLTARIESSNGCGAAILVGFDDVYKCCGRRMVRYKTYSSRVRPGFNGKYAGLSYVCRECGDLI